MDSRFTFEGYFVATLYWLLLLKLVVITCLGGWLVGDNYLPLQLGPTVVGFVLIGVGGAAGFPLAARWTDVLRYMEKHHKNPMYENQRR